ncbi:MAG: HD domain-containing protein [Oscillospiraceae bacterium]|nr:HD domain-containing protein [Oscillospiraceae bacterium]
MKKEKYSLIENYMLVCMTDSAHDREHIYRVLYNALEIAKLESNVDYEVLIVACLLHDIGRKEQFEDPALCHAMVGGEKAYRFLMENGFGEDFSERVRHCIQTHRFRKSMQPESVEAKILFDADKLDVTGALGIARTLMYKGNVAEPIYTMLPNGLISDGTQDDAPSFFREYKFKLEKLYDMFYTFKGTEMAQERRKNAVTFYESLYREVNTGYASGRRMLSELVVEDEH